MNRAICLQRPEPTEDDILLTGQAIVTSADNAGAGDDEGGEENLQDAHLS
jgi:hypothetical protein